MMGARTIHKAWRYLLIGGLLAVILIGVYPGVAFAQSSQFEQQIIPEDCDYDTYDTGKGRVHDPACPVFSPVISYYERTAEGGFIIYGAYDAIHTSIDAGTGKHKLTITFAGQSFTLGVDPELSVDGNAWVLDLSAWRDDKPVSVVPGDTVKGEVATITKATEILPSQTLVGETSITVPNYPKDITPAPGKTDGSKKPGDCYCQDSGSTYIYPWLFWLLIVIICLEALLIIRMMRRKKIRDEDETEV